MRKEPLQSPALQDFVRDVVVQIAQGLREAGEKVAEMDGEVMPKISGRAEDLAQAGYLRSDQGLVSFVEFDVALGGVTEPNKPSAIRVLVENVPVTPKDTRRESPPLSRIRFSVPIRFPRKNSEKR